MNEPYKPTPLLYVKFVSVSYVVKRGLLGILKQRAYLHVELSRGMIINIELWKNKKGRMLLLFLPWNK